MQPPEWAAYIEAQDPPGSKGPILYGKYQRIQSLYLPTVHFVE